jgi:hypothetical protein
LRLHSAEEGAMKAVGWMFVLAAAVAGLALAVACGGPPKPPMVPDTDTPDGGEPTATQPSTPSK